MDSENRIAELSAALGIAIGYLERVSQAKLRDPESHRRMIDRLTRVLDQPASPDMASAIVETATVACERAAELIEKNGRTSDPAKAEEYARLADGVREIFGKLRAR